MCVIRPYIELFRELLGLLDFFSINHVRTKARFVAAMSAKLAKSFVFG